MILNVVSMLELSGLIVLNKVFRLFISRFPLFYLQVHGNPHELSSQVTTRNLLVRQCGTVEKAN